MRALKDKTSLEEARIKQLNRICETAVMPLLGPLAAEASMTCTVRARNDYASIVLKDRKGNSGIPFSGKGVPSVNDRKKDLTN